MKSFIILNISEKNLNEYLSSLFNMLKETKDDVIYIDNIMNEEDSILAYSKINMPNKQNAFKVDIYEPTKEEQMQIQFNRRNYLRKLIKDGVQPPPSQTLIDRFLK